MPSKHIVAAKVSKWKSLLKRVAATRMAECNEAGRKHTADHRELGGFKIMYAAVRFLQWRKPPPIIEFLTFNSSVLSNL